MNRSSNAAHSTLGVTVKVAKQADGTYVAQPSGDLGKSIPPVVGRSESEAMNLCTQAVNKANSEGKI